MSKAGKSEINVRDNNSELSHVICDMCTEPRVAVRAAFLSRGRKRGRTAEILPNSFDEPLVEIV